jgi:L-malate glycosyltransferase
MANTMIKVLFITNELLITCGISKHLLYFLNEMEDQKEFEFSILCGGGDAVDVYRKICKEVIVDPRVKHENRSYLNYFISLFNLIGLIKKNKYNIIHSHTHYAANISSGACKFSNCRNVQTIHGLIPNIGKLNHFAGEFIVCVNEHIKEYLIKNKIKPKDKVKVIYNGVKEVNISDKKLSEKIRVIAASRFVEEKGLNIYIKAVNELTKDVWDKAEFLIAGKGPYENSLKNLTENLKTNITFIGEIDNFLEYLKTTDIFILPTVSETEGLPMTLIEAALTKNLIICSAYYGLNKIFEEELRQLLFEKGNYKALAVKMTDVIVNYAQYENVINSLFNKVKKVFGIEKMIPQLIGLYREVIK